eukprot:CAMPEP_0184680174 /NCGR_PEP_ID=MMETSP0312-20130426/3053_1 /TAXON_ID=31354 /ORGANISM="Compsopogon coeruleus, Strain SAG 36.94" /LENGTH=376 /DNA_ID=CAMNT_0027130113 /DNA_START=158 /DNA_END=1288 /DNA_ORIENTATION=+
MVLAAETAESTKRKEGLSAAVLAAGGAGMTKFDKMRLKFGFAKGKVEDSGFSYDDFEQEMGKYERSFVIDDVCSGKVYAVEQTGALVDIGAKASAFLPLSEMAIHPPDAIEDLLQVGDERDFQIISSEDKNGQLTISCKRLEFARAWERLAQMQSEDVTVRATITSVNRGGAMVEVENLRGFVPGSHMSSTANAEEKIGSEIRLKFLEVDQEKGRVVMSERRALVEQQMTDLAPGVVMEGTVKSIKPYGAFVDVGGMSGLLHISQISHDHVDNIEKSLIIGMSIKCMIINQDKEKGRISLSTKTLEPEPGDMLKNPQLVYEKAEEMAERYHKKREEEKKAAADVAEDIVASLDMASLEDLAIGSPTSSTEDDVFLQ